ncbi:MAG: amidase [Ottowia sp.]|uniref:amidase n=1 Tax=Ottowia sp. TaxID=1898956 RepID=UPI0039E319ED
MSALHEWTARECADCVNQGALRALDVARHFIERVQAVNPSINALVQFDPADVLRQAAQADERLARGECLPMAGVPVTIKDNLWVAGRTITQGSRLFADFVAPRDAWAVARLRHLGAVILGITNCSEFACKGVTDNLVYGPTRHPLDPALTPGGSSGGAVAALAAGLGLLALGTDAGGSVRRPAAHTGLVGLKPSQGLIPHPWGFGEPNYGVSVVGLLARNAADCAWLFDHLADFDAGDVSAPALPVDWQALSGTRQAPPRDWRIAWSPRLGCDFAIDQDVLSAVEASVLRLRERGWMVVEADPSWGQAVRDYPMDALQHAGLHALHHEALARRPHDIDPVLVMQIEAGARADAVDWARVLRARERIARELSRFFSEYDVLLCPTVPVVPWAHTELGPARIEGRPAGPRGHAVFTPLFNLCGVPACSVPAGQVRGAPVGLQIVAPRFEDARVLQMAALVERLAA